ncbi:hypothetical protein BV20DRAFT_330455 [Pilatotrama ljubarskyi]|nr:hypothetical protein BV20DRAFT_330455 [Pilatotrama ljubarskyi]
MSRSTQHDFAEYCVSKRMAPAHRAELPATRTVRVNSPRTQRRSSPSELASRCLRIMAAGTLPTNPRLPRLRPFRDAVGPLVCAVSMITTPFTDREAYHAVISALP